MSRLKALVVDDEWAIRALCAEVLEQEGFDVDTASDGEEALQVLAASRFDLLVTDLFMPRLSGADLLHETQAFPGLRKILVSGGTGPSVSLDFELSMFSEFEPDEILSKPFDVNALRRAVRRLFESSES